MKCPVCVKKDMRSSVYPGGATSTLMHCPSYFDEDGRYHQHDMNTMTQYFSCSLGHTWNELSKGSCPTCDFGKEKQPVIVILNDKENDNRNMVFDSGLIDGGDNKNTFINSTTGTVGSGVDTDEKEF